MVYYLLTFKNLNNTMESFVHESEYRLLLAVRVGFSLYRSSLCEKENNIFIYFYKVDTSAGLYQHNTVKVFLQGLSYIIFMINCRPVFMKSYAITDFTTKLFKFLILSIKISQGCVMQNYDECEKRHSFSVVTHSIWPPANPATIPKIARKRSFLMMRRHKIINNGTQINSKISQMN